MIGQDAASSADGTQDSNVRPHRRLRRLFALVPAMLLLLDCTLWAISLTPYHLDVLYNPTDRVHSFCIWREPITSVVPVYGHIRHVPFPFSTSSRSGRVEFTRQTPAVTLPAISDRRWPGVRVFRTSYDDGMQGGTMDSVVIDHWLIALPLALVCGIQLRGFWNRRRVRAGHCRCGYDLRATPDRCPECGAAVARVSNP